MLKRNASLLLFCVFALGLKAQDKDAIPAVVKNATYVMVITNSGDIFSPDVTPDDRHAVQDVQKTIEKWGRYKLVYNPGEADLILVVRTGRIADVKGGVQVATTTQRAGDRTDRSRASAESIGGEVGDPQDTLEVYMASRGINGPPLWRGRALDGLKAPQLRLMQEFRSKVEAPEKKKKP
jgi:hypothetical protein